MNNKNVISPLSKFKKDTGTLKLYHVYMLRLQHQFIN